MAIEGIRGRGTIGGAGARAGVRGASGFMVPQEAGTAGEARAAGLGGVGGASMLALQEADVDRHGDRPARRRGEALLDTLAALQRELLAPGGPDAATLRRMESLVSEMPEAASPGLREAVEAVRLRAVVEIARYEARRAIF